MPLSTPLSAIMISKPGTVQPEDKLSRARAVMFERRAHHVPVIDDSGVLVGMVSTNDLQRAAQTDRFESAKNVDAALDAFTVGQVMSTDLITVRPTDPIERAADLLGADSFHCLPVVNGHNVLLGIVTTGHVIRYLSEHRLKTPTGIAL